MGPKGGQGLEAPLNWPSTVATLRVPNPLATDQITTHKRGLWDSVLGSRTLYHHPTGDGDGAPYQLLLADNQQRMCPTALSQPHFLVEGTVAPGHQRNLVGEVFHRKVKVGAQLG